MCFSLARVHAHIGFHSRFLLLFFPISLLLPFIVVCTEERKKIFSSRSEIEVQKRAIRAAFLSLGERLENVACA